MPTLILHGDDDQIVPIGASAMLSSKIVKGATLKVYKGAPHGMCTTHKDQVNAELLAFIKAEACRGPQRQRTGRTMRQSLDRKVAVVTGGSTGIGFGIAKRFASEGASVVITGRRSAELDAAVQEIGAGAFAFRADVSILSDLDALFDLVKARHGRIDILVANAGGGELAALGDITEREHFDNTFNINVKGVLFTVQKALPLLGDGSSVILTGSTTSVLGGQAFSVYSATKAAVRNFARSWILRPQGQGYPCQCPEPRPDQDTGPPRAGAARPTTSFTRHVRSEDPARPCRRSRMRSARQPCSWRPMRRASSTASNSSSMAARRRCDPEALADTMGRGPMATVHWRPPIGGWSGPLPITGRP